ncbi:DUF6461 domain-containing protein [Streptomyces sp. NPDC096934]|uniref:DUF6461 domain-containing protein n=1 Tax=Streptomyces sp. NPDC096934 TaxID=3155551 RepID=UPI003318F339
MSAGTRGVSHLAGVNGRDGFPWTEDTVARLRFEPGVADRRCGDDRFSAVVRCHGPQGGRA